METDTEKELSDSQSAHNTEVGSVPEASSGETKTSVETAKAIKASKEDEQKDEAVENGNVAEENGEVIKENGEGKKEDGEPVSIQQENGEPTNVNGEAGHEEEESKENGDATNENVNTESTNENEDASQEVPSEQEATLAEDAGQRDADPSPSSVETPVTTSQEEGNIETGSGEPETQAMDAAEQEKQETQPGETEEKAPITEDPESESQEPESEMLETQETTQIDKVAEEVADVAVNEDINTDEQAEKITENIPNLEVENPPDQLVTDDKVAEEMTEEAPTQEADVTGNDNDNADEAAVDTSVPEESAEDAIKDELTTDEPVTEVQDAIDQVQVKIALNTDDMECVLENVAMVGDQVSNGAEHDPMEEDLETFAPAPIPVKEEKTPSIENQEQVLVDDEEMVITQITNLDELDPNVSVETNSDGQTKVIITTPVVPVEKVDIDQFTDTEDLVIYALDTISPFDAKFISQHMADRDEHQIERRLVDNAFRKKSFNFQKLPLMMFEMVFVSESNERMPSLMILTQRQLLQLTPKGSWCQYGPGIETIEMHFTNKTRFGVDTSALTEFIITNIPNMHMPYLRRNVREIEGFMETSKINFRKVNSSKKDLKQILNRAQSELTMDTLRIENMPLIKIDEEAVLHLKEEHEEMLVKIVKAVGRRHWEEVTKLLIAVFEYEVDVDVDDEEIYDKVRYYFETKLDPDLRSGQFTEDEDKCIIFMYKYWSKIMEDEEVWSTIARHLEGRTGNQVKNRFQRKSGCPTDLTLNNILTYPDDPTNPATFNNDLAHMFSLTIVKKNLAPELEITTKLQYEENFLVMGTVRELYIRPCRDTSIKTKYPGIVQHNFTYDPTRPPQQFLTFVKLTFGNGLKKLGLLDDPDAFNFNNIEYNGPTIHELISAADHDRFVVPKDIFMLINRRMEGDQVVEFVLPVKRKYTRKIDRLDLHQRDEFQREQIKIRSTPPAAKRPRRK